MMSKKLRLVCVCGATATGKTEVAFELARALHTEIISFDSLQVYRELDIGTAKPSLNMRTQIKHHLVDEVSPKESFTAGDFRRRALQIISETNKSEIVLVGGTGFYLQALLKGMYDIPQISDETKSSLKGELEIHGVGALYEELSKADPDYARKIHPHDTYRILRALEILRSGSKTMTEIRKQFETHTLPFSTTMIGLRRTKSRLKELVERRTQGMLESGLVQETRGLLEKYPEGLKPLESVGYKETSAYLRGELSDDTLKAEIVKNTMLLAKRQSTWFKRDSQIRWFDPDTDSVLEEALKLATSS